MAIDPQARKDINQLQIISAAHTQRLDDLEQDVAEIKLRLATLEEKVASLNPCPEEPEEPEEPDPPVPPDPPEEPDLFLLAGVDEVSFTSENGQPAPTPQAVVLFKSGTGTLVAPVVQSVVDPDDIIASTSITQIDADTWHLTIVPALAPAGIGSYAATVSVRSSNQTNETVTIEVSSEITPIPLRLDLSATEVSVSVNEGLDAEFVDITLLESGDGILDTPIAGAPSQAWIANVAITGASPLWNARLTFDTDLLLPGMHIGTVLFNSANATNGSKLSTVALTVVDIVDPPPPDPDPPTLTLSATPGSLSFSDVSGGGLPAAQVIRLHLVGIGDLDDPVITGQSDASAIIASAVITNVDADEWDLTVSMATKAAETYEATITVASPNQVNPAIVIPITYTVTVAAVPLTFQLSQSVLNLSVQEGSNLVPANITLQASGDGVLNTPTAGAPSAAWMSGVNISGADPLWNAQIIFDTDALAVGAHQLTIDFSSTNGTNNPRTLTINLTVSANPAIPPPTSTYKGAALPVGDQQIVFNSATRVFDNTVMVTSGISFGGVTYTPAAGDFAALQAACDAAVAGDIIQLVPGSIYEGVLTLPAGLTNYVLIRSGTLAGLPPAGERVFPSDTVNMATLRGPNTTNVIGIKVAQGAKFWYLQGIHIAPPSSAIVQGAMVSLNSPSIASESDYAERFIFDRCVAVGRDTGNGVRRVFRADAKYVAWLDCYLGDTGEVGSDAQAIYTNSGGPFKIINCHIAAIGEGILTGSAQTAFVGAHVHDLEVRRCEFTNLASWIGVKANIKNLFESKGLRRGLFEGNYFHRNPPAAQVGFFFVLTNYSHSNRDEDNIDIVVYGTRVSQVGSGFNQLQSNPRAGSHGRIVYDQIVIDQMGGTGYNGDRKLFQFLRGTGNAIMDKITVHHVTAYTPLAIQLMSLENATVPVGQDLDFKDCAVSQGQYGIFRSGGAQWTQALNLAFSQWTFVKNALVGTSNPPAPNNIPAGNYGPTTATVLFVDPIGGDYHIKAGAPGENGASDGADVGADIDFVATLTNGCLTGVWP